MYHEEQQLEDGHRPIEHSCKKENEKSKCRTLIETNILEEPKYRDKKGKKYPDIESFQNKTTLPEIEIQKSQRKRKEIALSSREEERNKLRITNMNYQTNNEDEVKKEKGRTKKTLRKKKRF